MSKKHKSEKTNGVDEREGAEPREGDTPELEEAEPDTQAAETYALGVRDFILTRGGWLAALDAESIAAMLTALGIDPDAAPTPVEVKEPAEEDAPVGDGEAAPTY